MLNKELLLSSSARPEMLLDILLNNDSRVLDFNVSVTIYDNGTIGDELINVRVPARQTIHVYERIPYYGKYIFTVHGGLFTYIEGIPDGVIVSEPPYSNTLSIQFPSPNVITNGMTLHFWE